MFQRSVSPGCRSIRSELNIKDKRQTVRHAKNSFLESSNSSSCHLSLIRAPIPKKPYSPSYLPFSPTPDFLIIPSSGFEDLRRSRCSDVENRGRQSYMTIPSLSDARRFRILLRASGPSEIRLRSIPSLASNRGSRILLRAMTPTNRDRERSLTFLVLSSSCSSSSSRRSVATPSRSSPPSDVPIIYSISSFTILLLSRSKIFPSPFLMSTVLTCFPTE